MYNLLAAYFVSGILNVILFVSSNSGISVFDFNKYTATTEKKGQ